MTHWIKLYLDILKDPKMGLLDDTSFRRAIELFLLAADHDKNGELPTLKFMAWSSLCAGMLWLR